MELNFAELFVETSAGELFYFLLAVGLSFTALLVAIDQRTRSRQESAAGRYVVALLGVVAAWGLLTLGNLYTLLVADANAGQILPPLERASTMLVLIMLSWAFLTADSPHPESPTRLLAIALSAAVGLGYLATILRWEGGGDFNQSPFAWLWTAFPILLMAGALGLLLLRYQDAADIPLKLCFFLLVIIGHAITLYQISADPLGGDAAGAVRLFMLAALALVPVILYRLVVERFRGRVGEISQMVLPLAVSMSPGSGEGQDTNPVAIPPRALREPPNLSSLQEAQQLMRVLGLLLENPDPELMPEQVVRAMARTFQADIAALVIPRNANWAEVSTAYDFLRDRLLPGLTINLDLQPLLVQVQQQNRQGVLLPQEHDDQLRDLFHRLGSEQTHPIGPAYFQPLSINRRVIGLIILAMPYTTRLLNETESTQLEAVAVLVARLLALSNATVEQQFAANSEFFRQMVQGKPLTMPEMDQLGVSIREEMQGRLDEAQVQIRDLNEEIMQLRYDLHRERQKLKELQPQDADALSLTQRIQVITEERQRLQTEREQLMEALNASKTLLAGATADTDESLYRQMVESLKQEKMDLVAERERLRHELKIMRASSGDLGSLQTVLDTLRAERDRLAQDRAMLSNQIEESQAQLADLGVDMGMMGLGQLLAHLTEERNRFMQEAKHALAERDLLLREREGLEAQVLQKAQIDRQVESLQEEVVRLSDDRSALVMQRDALRTERDALNQQREEWLMTRAKMATKYETLRQRLYAAHHALKNLQAGQESQAPADPASLAPSPSGKTEEIRVLKGRVDEVEEERSRIEFELLRAQEDIEVLENEVIRYQKLLTAPNPEGAERNLAETMTSMAQELRTPITSILGYTDTLLGESTGILGTVQQKFLLRIRSNTERLLRMLEDLLRVVAIDLGNLALAPQQVDIADIIYDAITESSAQYKEKGLSLHMDIADQMPQMLADRDAMQQLLGELLMNAYLASPAESVVRISAQFRPAYKADKLSKAQDVIYVAVTDQGGGIPIAEQDRVFKRLYRADNTLIEGLGDKSVGMSIAHALVVAHGGRIWFEVEGNSTTFKVVLPIQNTFGQKELLRGRLSRLVELFEGEDEAAPSA